MPVRNNTNWEAKGTGPHSLALWVFNHFLPLNTLTSLPYQISVL